MELSWVDDFVKLFYLLDGLYNFFIGKILKLFDVLCSLDRNLAWTFLWFLLATVFAKEAVLRSKLVNLQAIFDFRNGLVFLIFWCFLIWLDFWLNRPKLLLEFFVTFLRNVNFTENRHIFIYQTSGIHGRTTTLKSWLSRLHRRHLRHRGRTLRVGNKTMKLCQPIAVTDRRQLHLTPGVLASTNQIEVVKRHFGVTSSLHKRYIYEAFLHGHKRPTHAMVPHHLRWDARVPLWCKTTMIFLLWSRLI